MEADQGLSCIGVCGGWLRVGWLHVGVVRKEEEVLIPCPSLLVVDTKMLGSSYWIPVRWTCS